jgi:hypothetical protein
LAQLNDDNGDTGIVILRINLGSKVSKGITLRNDDILLALSLAVVVVEEWEVDNILRIEAGNTCTFDGLRHVQMLTRKVTLSDDDDEL